MDDFEIIDLVYSRVAAANTGMTVYKDRSKTGETENHIVVSQLTYQELDWENVMPVNVNIFIKLSEQSGMTNRPLAKETKRKIMTELRKIAPVAGKYQSIYIEGSTRLINLKEGFDCINIKVIINTEKSIENYG